MNKIYILGAGSQARETYQIYKDEGKGKDVKGFIVSQRIREKKLLGKKILGLETFKALDKNALLISAVGNPLKREKLVGQIKKFGLKYDLPIHKSVIKGRNVVLGEGTTVCAGNVITCDVKIGKHVLINVGCTVSHDVKLGDFVTLSPGVHLGGRVEIGKRTFLGIGAAVIQDVKIGKNCFIGAGAVVVSNIPDNALALGVPAKTIRKITETDWLDLI